MSKKISYNYPSCQMRSVTSVLLSWIAKITEITGIGVKTWCNGWLFLLCYYMLRGGGGDFEWYIYDDHVRDRLWSRDEITFTWNCGSFGETRLLV